MNNEKQHGFTLIELLITMVIVGILAAIAYPSYEKFIIKGRRSAAESAMMDIANREQQYFLANRAYTDSLNALNYTAPSDVTAWYTPTVTIDQVLDSSCATATDNTVPSFVVEMDPGTTNAQASDGALYLSSAGVKCPSTKW